MRTVEILEEGLRLAERMGYRVRQEWLGGSGGGGCEIRGRKYFFLDLALSPEEQLGQLLDTLRHEPMVLSQPIPAGLSGLLQLPKSA